MIACRTVQRSACLVLASGKGQLLAVESVQPGFFCLRFDGVVGRLQATPGVHPSNRPTSSSLTAQARTPARVYGRDGVICRQGLKILVTRLDGWTDAVSVWFIAVQPARLTLFCGFWVGRIDMSEKRQQWEMIKEQAPDVAEFLIGINEVFGKPAAVRVELLASGEVIEIGGRIRGDAVVPAHPVAVCGDCRYWRRDLGDGAGRCASTGDRGLRHGQVDWPTHAACRLFEIKRGW